MLRLSTEHRPRQLLAVYVEPQRVEILRAHRQWRSWQIDAVEHFEIPQGESVFDALQRLNLRPRSWKATALVVVLPLTFYTFHREHYPAGLQDQLQEALNYDWQENIFQEHDRTLHFSGPPLALNHHLSVPIFTLQREVFEKFEQVLGGASFQNFRIIPSALMYRAFVAPSSQPGDDRALTVYARLLDASHLEIHRYYRGQLLESTLLGKHPDDLKLFLEHLQGAEAAVGTETAEASIPIHLLCAVGEACDLTAYQALCGDAVRFELKPLDNTLVSPWVNYLISQDQVPTFDLPLVLKPWQIPRIVWPLLVAVLLYSVFAVFQIATHHQRAEESRRLRKELGQLETQWKPIEQLQSRIAKFQEDQKTLSEFNREGYPLYEVLSVLSQVTPEDTWLNYFSIRKGQIVLRGESKSAIKFLSELSKIEGFGDVRFASPVTRSPTADSERFNVQYQLDAEKLKKTIDGMDLYKQEEAVEQGFGDLEAAPPQLMKEGRPAPTGDDSEAPDEDSLVEEEEGGEEEVAE